MIDWRNVSLLGIDVGYSPVRATTGIASYRFGREVHLQCVRYSSEERRLALAHGPIYDAVAIDGPLVRKGFQAPRNCERLLARGAFGKRCKAGYSHFGEGTKLRAAATLIAGEGFHACAPDAPTVEAFPNAFLGVMLDDNAYASFPERIPRGTKSDLFYARAAVDGCFERLFEELGWHDELFKTTVREWAMPATRVAHEYRAAIICILTAACALSDLAEYIGDRSGGFICLPPRALWADWARTAYRGMETTAVTR